MDAVEPERVPNHVELFDERLDDPERIVFGEVGLATADLVVEDDSPASRFCECLQGLEIVMCRPGATVQQDDGQLSVRLVVADNAVPRPVAAEGNKALVRVHGVTLTHRSHERMKSCPNCCRHCTEVTANRSKSSLRAILSSTSSRRQRWEGTSACVTCWMMIQPARTPSATTAFTHLAWPASSATRMPHGSCSSVAQTRMRSRETSTFKRPRSMPRPQRRART